MCLKSKLNLLAKQFDILTQTGGLLNPSFATYEDGVSAEVKAAGPTA